MANKIATKNDAIIKCGLGNITDGIPTNKLCTANYAQQIGCSINSKTYTGSRLVPTEILTGGFVGTFVFTLDISPRYFDTTQNYIISDSATAFTIQETIYFIAGSTNVDLVVNNGYLKAHACEIACNSIAYLHRGSYGALSICMGSFIVPSMISVVTLSM